MKTLLILSVLFLSACAQTRWVRKAYDPRGGVIAYRNEALNRGPSLKQADAYAKEHCGGPYVVKAEGEVSDPTGVMAVGNQLMVTNHSWVNIEFDCEQKEVAGK